MAFTALFVGGPVGGRCPPYTKLADGALGGEVTRSIVP